MWYMHTVEYYSALKMKKILTYATTSIKLGDIMLSEISQTQKTNTNTVLQVVKFIETQ